MNAPATDAFVDVTTRDGVVEVALSTEPCNEIGEPNARRPRRRVSQPRPRRDPRGHPVQHRPPRVQRGCRPARVVRGPAERRRERAGERIEAFIHRIHDLFDLIDQLPVTTIAAVHGVCFGGGFELALTADIIVAERTARFAFPELRLGLIPGFGGIPRLERDVGGAVVRDLLLTGRSYNAAKAVSVGLASQQVGRGEGARGRSAPSRARRPASSRRCRRRARRSARRCRPSASTPEKAQFLEMIQRPDRARGPAAVRRRRRPMPWLPGDA